MHVCTQGVFLRMLKPCYLQMLVYACACGNVRTCIGLYVCRYRSTHAPKLPRRFLQVSDLEAFGLDSRRFKNRTLLPGRGVRCGSLSGGGWVGGRAAFALVPQTLCEKSALNPRLPAKVKTVLVGGGPDYLEERKVGSEPMLLNCLYEQGMCAQTQR